MVTTGVVCVATAGLLLGVQCHGHCHRKGKIGQTEIPPVYEDIPLEKTPPIELTQTMFSLHTVYFKNQKAITKNSYSSTRGMKQGSFVWSYVSISRVVLCGGG